MPLLITDLDNTLYDWVTYFARSFTAMVEKLVEDTGLEKEQLLDEFKTVHQHYGDSEQPFAILDVPSIQKLYGAPSRQQLMKQVNGALHAFNSARLKHLKLYQGVEESLKLLHGAGVTLVGHTEALAENAYYRLEKLRILPYFSHLYALQSSGHGHPDPVRAAELRLPDTVRHIPKDERKPNPALIADICSRERKSPDETWYVGDSITRDVSMAKSAGVRAIWAKYGRSFERKDWDTLVRITHWTDEDVRREEELRRMYANSKPDYEIDQFSDLLPLLLGRNGQIELGRASSG